MGRPAAIPDELRAGPFRAARARALGLTPRQLQARAWRHLCNDVYCLAEIADTPALRLAAVRLVIPGDATVSGRTAAWLLGCDVRRSSLEPVEVTAPRGVTLARRGGLVVPRQAFIPEADVVEVDGVRLTSALRTAFDLARRPDLAEGVVALDALWRTGLIDVHDLLPYAAEHRGWRGIRQVPKAVALADKRSENPMESRLRMVLVIRGGLPKPAVQLEILRDGHVIARLDLAYEDSLLDVEFDGQGHVTDLPVRLRDRRRYHDLIGLGWRTLAFDAADVYQRPTYICQQVRRNLRRTA